MGIPTFCNPEGKFSFEISLTFSLIYVFLMFIKDFMFKFVGEVAQVQSKLYVLVVSRETQIR